MCIVGTTREHEALFKNVGEAPFSGTSRFVMSRMELKVLNVCYVPDDLKNLMARSEDENVPAGRIVSQEILVDVSPKAVLSPHKGLRLCHVASLLRGESNLLNQFNQNVAMVTIAGYAPQPLVVWKDNGSQTWMIFPLRKDQETFSAGARILFLA